jgi:hypothetical protein
MYVIRVFAGKHFQLILMFVIKAIYNPSVKHLSIVPIYRVGSRPYPQTLDKAGKACI